MEISLFKYFAEYYLAKLHDDSIQVFSEYKNVNDPDPYPIMLTRGKSSGSYQLRVNKKKETFNQKRLKEVFEKKFSNRVRASITSTYEYYGLELPSSKQLELDITPVVAPVSIEEPNCVNDTGVEEIDDSVELPLFYVLREDIYVVSKVSSTKQQEAMKLASNSANKALNVEFTVLEEVYSCVNNGVVWK